MNDTAGESPVTQPETIKGIPLGGSIGAAYQNINVGHDSAGGGATIQQNIVDMVQKIARPRKKKGQTYLPGRSVFIENVEKCTEEQIQALFELIQKGLVQQVVVKICEGTKRKIALSSKKTYPIIRRLQDAGCQVWGWQLLTSDLGTSQAAIAAESITRLKLSGYIAQVGSEFATIQQFSAREKEIRRLFDYLQTHIQDIPCGVMTYHYPSYHREIPWKAILEKAAFIAPQVFWQKAHNPGAQLLRSLLEFQNLKPNYPIIPIASTYALQDWQPTESELIEFVQLARGLRLPGVGFYHWDWLGADQTLPKEKIFAAWNDETLGQEYVQKILAQLEETTEEAPEEQPVTIPAPEFSRQFIQIIRNDDIQNVKDALGFDTYAQAFVEMVLDNRTKPPLTIGISGAWGSGKSFLLKRIHELLEKQAGRGPQKRIHIVRFNAWDYNTYNAIWPGLVRQLIETLEQSLHPRQLPWARLKRNLRREYKAIRNKLIPWGLIAMAALVTLVIAAGENWEQRLASLGAISLAGLIPNLVKMANEPVASWMTRLFTSDRTYGEILDYMGEIRDDINALRQNLPKDQKIVVIIDDLDRCTADKIAGTLETIKLLLTYDIFFIFLAIDTGIVARAVEQHHKDLLAEANRSGYLYLDKIIQIPFRIPEPNAAHLYRYLTSLLKGDDEPITANMSQTEAKRLASKMQIPSKHLAKAETFLTTLPNDPTEIERTIQTVYEQYGSDELAWVAQIWGLISRWWPVSAYLMHKQLRQERRSSHPPVHPDADTSQAAEPSLPRETYENILPYLFGNLKAHIESDIQSRRLQEQVDASIEMLEQATRYAPPISIDELTHVLQQWSLPYTLILGFDPKEIEAFHLLSRYLYKNPRHIKRLVNTYSLIRMLVAHSPNIEDTLVLHAPETMLKWLILSGQWPLTAQVMLYEFENEIQADPNRPLPEDDDALKRLYEKATRRINTNPDLYKERNRLDYDPDVLQNLINDGLIILTSRHLNVLRTLTINFNPAETSQPLVAVRALQSAVAA